MKYDVGAHRPTTLRGEAALGRAMRSAGGPRAANKRVAAIDVFRLISFGDRVTRDKLIHQLMAAPTTIDRHLQEMRLAGLVQSRKVNEVGVHGGCTYLTITAKGRAAVSA